MDNIPELNPVVIERASEQLRQERETFNQAKLQEQWWFALRIIMGFTSIILLICVMIVTIYILFNNSKFPTNVVSGAGAALFLDILGMLIGIWKITLNPKSINKLQPTSKASIPDVLS